MPILLFVAILLSAFVIAFCSMPLVIKIAYKVGAIDQPDQRKVHKHNMPRLGGMAIFLAFIICLLLSGKVAGPLLGVVYGAVIIFIVGMLDDIFQLSPLVKLIGQIIAAAVAIHYGVVVHFVTNPFDGWFELGILSLPLTFLWIVGVSNAINLIDGLDGLAAGVSGIAATTLGIVSLMQGQITVALAAFILVAALAGFLPYNFHPAKTFMGDGGSNFLGFVLACLSIMGTAKSAAVISLFVPIVILGIPIFDTFFAIIRRINNRTPIFLPDKAHLHHRLMALGMSHRRSVLIIYGISAFFSAVAVILTFITRPNFTLIIALLLLTIVVLAADKIGMFTGEKSRARSGIVRQGQTHRLKL